MKMLRIMALILLVATASVTAQEKTGLALTDITFTNVSETKGMIAYEYILNEINRSGLFSVVERAALDRAIEEMQIAATGLIDESTAAELGRLVGAEQIIISNLILEGELLYLSMRILDVETGEVLQTAVQDIFMDGNLERLVERTVTELIGFLYIDENGRMVQQDFPSEQVPSRDYSRGLQFSLRPLIAIPLGKSSDSYPLGAGVLANVDFRVVQMGPVYLTLGVQSGFITESTKDNWDYPHEYLQIPAAIQSTFWIDLGSWYINARLGGGIAFTRIAYSGARPASTDETTQSVALALYPGISGGYHFTDSLGVSLFCDYNMVFQEGDPYIALLTGISLEISL